MYKNLLVAWKGLPFTFKAVVLTNLYSIGDILYRSFFTNYLYEATPWGIKGNIFFNIFSTIFGIVTFCIFLYILYTRKKKLFKYYVYFVIFNTFLGGYYFVMGNRDLDIQAQGILFAFFLCIVAAIFTIFYRQRNYFNK